MPLNELTRIGGVWVAGDGRRATPGPAVGTREWRASLVPGTFLPDDRTNGLLYGTKLADVSAAIPGDLEHVDLGSSTLTLGTVPVYNKLYWGKIKMARNGWNGTGSAGGNIAVAGPRPDLVTPGDVFYLVSAYDTDTSQHAFDDVLVNPLLWMRSDAPGGPWTETQIREAYLNSVGVKGGYGTFRNWKVANCQDDWQWSNNRVDDADTRFTLIEHPWLEHPIWYAGPLWPSQLEGTHSDNLQPQVGQNFTARGGLIGGPNDPDSLTAAGCGVTWKQEDWRSGTTPLPAWRKQRNIHYDRVMFWFASGGNFNVNIAYNPTYPNDFSDDCSMTGCLHVFRDDAKYVNREAAYFAHLDDPTNRVISNPSSGTWTDLGAVTYTNG
ncbi:hypothetical protein OEB99_16450 [Actinotalea sp. M2MS4P-6]|uniref:hypothetical protein n=1 Tax=Actinotalea sp. M2MS4P-6 TaxID=2983762 RepID=UPI0021E36AFD|nr:hypothetical protein [Actinotalea sp. M2MS4P-6]MCV2395907.1 hypothetical protein [Actinotalea sp. M2MS4P-6]